MGFHLSLTLLASATVLAFSMSIYADNHSCPDERPHPRGVDACDSCPWEDVLADYKAGELSTIRESEVFDHDIRVSVVCDVNRTVDVDDVYEKIAVAEQKFDEIFGSVLSRDDGLGRANRPKILEIVTGICDYGGGIDDCVLYTVCRDVTGGSCSVSNGIAYFNSGGVASHIAFVPYLPEGKFWWVDGNRYGNLQHEFAHLLDFTYFRIDGQSGKDLDWWIEGMPQLIQWEILNDQLSWGRGNDRARLLDIFTHRWNTNNYYDGMRVLAYFKERAPWLVQAVASEIRSGIYTHSDLHLSWHTLMGHIAARHQYDYEGYTSPSRRERTMDDILPSPTHGRIEDTDNRH